MGARGPVPKRSRERRRQNRESKPDTAKAIVPTVKRPPVKSHWHAIAKSWFRSLSDSGQAQFYEPSDWQVATYVAEMMSRHLHAKRLSAQMFASVLSAMTDLLTTEGARRRARLEIERDPPEETPAGVTAIGDYRKRLANR